MDENKKKMEEMTPRNYQSELEEIACQQNTIIHLPTGSGKTFIALSLITRFKASLKPPWGQGGKRTFFLVNTVPLVNQQKNVINGLCPVQGVQGYTSEEKVDYWKKPKWDEELSKYQVIVMTAQILADMLQHDYIAVSDINVLIFDECHRAVEDHPMRLIMKHFNSCPVEHQPRVLGLTATLLNGNVNLRDVPQTIRTLETTFHATIATVNNLGEILDFSTNPVESFCYFNDPVLPPAALKAIKVLNEMVEMTLRIEVPKGDLKLPPGQKDISKDPYKVLKRIKNMANEIILYITELGVYGGSLTALSHIILLEQMKRNADKEAVTIFDLFISYCILVRKILEDHMKNETGYDKIIKHSSQQVLELLEVLKHYNPDNFGKPKYNSTINSSKRTLSGIIFTKQRFKAKVLYNIMKEVVNSNPKEFSFLKHEYVVGFNTNPFKNTREQTYSKKQSMKVLIKYANGDLNCLISTDVLEEGIDIPQCTLVVRFDPVQDYRSYIQGKGRARHSDSDFIMFVNNKDRHSFHDKLNKFMDVENHLQRMLIGDVRDGPSDKEIEGLYEEDVIPPYINPYNGNRLSWVSAVSLLNRYCSMLPGDQFTTIAPVYILEKSSGEGGPKVVTIIMPITCPYRDEIKSLPMENVKYAKRSAALRTCVVLHQTGELDQQTMLPIPYGKVDLDSVEISPCFPNWPTVRDDDPSIPKPGTKKRIRKHYRQHPSCLKGFVSWKSGQKKFYLHLIHLKTKFKPPVEEPREMALYNFINEVEGFALLTLNPLPKLCDFPMFTTIGEVTTSIQMNYSSQDLNLEEFELVKEFHHLMFDQVLSVAKKFVVFNPKESALFVVPTKFNNKIYSINWDVMKTYKSIRPTEPPSVKERKNLIVTQEIFKNSVVTPWYRNIIMPDWYIVSNVLEYLTPLSHFGSDEHETFESYYQSKYGLEILGSKDQPLLEVRNITTRMNCLLPRAATIKELTDKQRKELSKIEGDDKSRGFPELFVPEFCVKQDFPGMLWYKGYMLPSILHRVIMLLMANELRENIARDTGLGVVTLPEDKSWQPIEVNTHIVQKSLLSQLSSAPPPAKFDRINNPIDSEDRPPVKILGMKENMYKLQLSKLDKEYLWDAESEPVDIERNITTATVFDIEYYNDFINQTDGGGPESGTVAISTFRNTSPNKTNTSHAAILPPPYLQKEKINVLHKGRSTFGPELRDMLASLTTIKSADSFNLERVETLGDSFLKFAATLYLYHKFPKMNEGQLTNIKGKLIGNRNLFYAGNRINLGGRMKVEQFSPRKDFVLPAFGVPTPIAKRIADLQIRPTCLLGKEFSRAEALSGEILENTARSILSHMTSDSYSVDPEPDHDVQPSMQCYLDAVAIADKNISDCVEAVIGTYLLDSGIEGGTTILEWLRVIPKEDNIRSYYNKVPNTILTEMPEKLKDVEFLLNDSRSEIEEIMGYRFKDPSLLLEAMSHPSYIRNRLTRSYERLEFLGDAILDFLITSYVYEQNDRLKPGELTDLRSSLVNNVTFASFVVKLGLQKYICYHLNPLLESAIMKFVDHQTSRNHQIDEEIIFLINEKDCQIAEYVEVPKVLSDIFESLAGAIYLDSGGNLSTVWAVYYRIMYREIHAYSANIPRQPVPLLMEMIHACPSFGEAKVFGESVSRILMPLQITKNGKLCMVHGVGNNKFQAKRAAAKLALKMLSVPDLN